MPDYPDITELLATADDLDELAASWQLSEASKLFIKNATYLLRLAAERERDKREFSK